MALGLAIASFEKFTPVLLKMGNADGTAEKTNGCHQQLEVGQPW
jgi:hypothetical protein